MLALKSIIGLVPMLCGLASIVVVAPLATLMGTMAQRVRKDIIAKTDARVQLVTEVLSSAPRPLSSSLLRCQSCTYAPLHILHHRHCRTPFSAAPALGSLPPHQENELALDTQQSAKEVSLVIRMFRYKGYQVVCMGGTLQEASGRRSEGGEALHLQNAGTFPATHPLRRILKSGINCLIHP